MRRSEGEVSDSALVDRRCATHAVRSPRFAGYGHASLYGFGVSQQNYVYFYRTLAGAPVYVGYGHDVKRALTHSGHSHNDDLQAWLASNTFDLRIAGPYASESEAKAVEAALISSLTPRFNVAPGDGPKFVPVGVPPDLWERPQMEPLSLEQLGRLTGGALLVYLAPGDFLGDGRKKFDAALPTDADAVSNIQGMWDLSALLGSWSADPNQGPQVLIGIHGPVKHRFVVGALRIDTSRWGRKEFYIDDRRRWRVPLADQTELDACQLRGRRVVEVKFGQFSHQLHIWVDADGRRRHPAQ